jgi:hypothetical protein
MQLLSKKAVTAEFKGRYAKLSKKEKGILLDQFTDLTGYNRSYASRILNLKEGKTIGCAKVYGKKVKYVLYKNKRIKRKNSRIYGLGYIFCLIKIC